MYLRRVKIILLNEMMLDLITVDFLIDEFIDLIRDYESLGVLADDCAEFLRDKVEL